MTKVLSVYMYAKLARHVIYNGVDTNTKTNLDEKTVNICFMRNVAKPAITVI